MNENQSRGSGERDANWRDEYRRVNEEGAQFLGFGWDADATYDEAWSWIMKRGGAMNEIIKDCSLIDDGVLKFTSWFRTKKEAMRRG